MKRAVYLSVLSRIEAQQVWDQKEILHKLQSEFPEERPDTLRTIISQVYVQRAKDTYRHHRSPRRRQQLYQAVRKEVDKGGAKLGILNRIARERNFSPVLTARLVIEEYLMEDRDEDVSKNDVREHLLNTHLIGERDPRLALEVRCATWADDIYGPYAECVRASVGVEYEDRLKAILRDRGIKFKDEDDLRKEGFDKTPDVKLTAPICVDGRVVNWVESKALFGDESTHAQYIKDQLSSYWNRFGPGMVIYWFGFVEEITSLVKYGGVMVRESFPAEGDSHIVEIDPFWDMREAERSLMEDTDEEEEEEEKLAEGVQRLAV